MGSQDEPVVSATATYVIGIWGKCKHFLRRGDDKPAAPHNHMPCTCPPCSKSKQPWYKCVMTEKWLRDSEITKTQEQGG